ncbi:MAG: hypothetical protein A2174_03185 [Candidatus Portnoybacteria bacterium RBG_13_41_18]|uniref:Uncharacterized protein n=1 Tax=Candidatus Portnoybacteria bacterium RBG_13_41_18 TaxID=1801991 RepID=A0A1G2F5K6_9BACT|nr:MAG: hypothetical protein A2174_03185 [Candidatus Portnoybacteria bacterium RBG_13_41_18]
MSSRTCLPAIALAAAGSEIQFKMKYQKNITAQEIQDNIFRKMSVEKKLRLADDFFRFAKILRKARQQNGKSKTVSKAGKNL